VSPGRELDALIAEVVMGWRWHRYDPLSGQGRYLESPSDRWGGRSGAQHWDGSEPTYFDGLPSYSTDVVAAFEVAERVIKGDLHTMFELTQAPGQGWACRFRTTAMRAQGETPAHAICLAALRARGIDAG
jgi:hypothetical protein